MLLYQVLYGFVSVLYFLLSGLDFLRARTVRVSSRSDASTVYDWHSLLLERLLIHFVDKKIDILTHLLELVSQLLVLRLQKLLFLRVVPKSFYKFWCVPHLLQLLTCILEGLFNEFIWVTLLYYFLMVRRNRVTSYL